VLVKIFIVGVFYPKCVLLFFLMFSFTTICICFLNRNEKNLWAKWLFARVVIFRFKNI
jgi:hypothetical protein